MKRQSLIKIYVIAALILAAIAYLLFENLRFGSFETSPAQVFAYLAHDDGSNTAFSLREIRLPRALCALLTGAALALSGALIQVITRNPLGDPGLTGVTGGAAFGVALAVTFLPHVTWIVLFSGIAGGFVAATITFMLTSSTGFRDVQVILAGVSVSIFFIAATSALMILQKSSMQSLYYWMIGGFANKGWAEFAYLWPWVATGLIAALTMAPVLEILRLDDTVARSLGLSVARWRIMAGALSVCLASVSVAVAGPIAFVGFVAPHIVRRVCAKFGSQHLPLFALFALSVLLGGLLTVAADLGARALPLGNRAPAGVLITVLGGLSFLILSRRDPSGTRAAHGV